MARNVLSETQSIQFIFVSLEREDIVFAELRRVFNSHERVDLLLALLQNRNGAERQLDLADELRFATRKFDRDVEVDIAVLLSISAERTEIVCSILASCRRRTSDSFCSVELGQKPVHGHGFDGVRSEPTSSALL